MVVRLVLLAGFVALGVSCAGDGDTGSSVLGATSVPTGTVTEDEASGGTGGIVSTRDQQRPGTGRSVTLARGEEFDTWFAAAIYERLLAELGYTVIAPTDPIGADLGAEAAFAAVARGQADVWTGALFPLHDTLLENLLDGDRVGDRVLPLGQQSPNGAMEGVLASRDWVAANGIFHLDDLAQASNAADFDVDGNGVPDIFGCRVGTTCSAVLDRLILSNGWNLEQITSGEGTILDSALARMGSGEPTLIFGWTPSAVVAALEPGVDVVWMSVRQPNPDWSNEAAGATPQECPARPCITGFFAADVRAVVNVDFVERDPVATTLIEQVSIPATDVSVQNEELSRITGIDGELTTDALRNLELEVDRLASEWISTHRGDVGVWLDLARAAR